MELVASLLIVGVTLLIGRRSSALLRGWITNGRWIGDICTRRQVILSAIVVPMILASPSWTARPSLMEIERITAGMP